MSSRRDIPGDRPIEDDPTGVRALLRGLPDPGPMPAQLVERISASVVAERVAAHQHPDRPTTASVGDTSHGGTRRGLSGHSLAPLGGRRNPWRSLGAVAAAVALVGVVGAALLTGTSPGDVAASLRGHDGSGAASSAGAGASTAGAPASHPASTSRLPATGTVAIYRSGRAYHSSRLGAEAAALVGAGLPRARQRAAESPAVDPMATMAGVRSCAAALGLEPSAGIAVDVATVDGRPGAVLVVAQGAHPTAYAVLRSCATGHPDLIAGPTALD